MKKILLTAVVAFSTLVASAQFMVVTTYDSNDGVEGLEVVTNNLGLGYMVNDAFTIGLAKGGDVITAGTATTDADTSDGYNVWVRYNIVQVEGAYASLQMPTKDGSDNMKIGVGFAFNVFKSLYIEPSYTMPTKEDPVTEKREGTFNFGLSYRF
ncbi:porin family protein [Flavobacteriales bacterium]|nr:porin family protein [Flavobacteriales bacterium]